MTEQNSTHVFEALALATELLERTNRHRESQALKDVLEICRQPTAHGGLGISEQAPLGADQECEILFLVSAWLEALNSTDRVKSPPVAITQRPHGRRGMTLGEKIFAMHDIEQKGFVAPGEFIRIYVDWVMDSEASWAVGPSRYSRRR